MAVMRVFFLPVARLEVGDAQDWYEREQRGLGRRFRAELSSTVERIESNPLQFPVVHRDLRRARVRVFPYSLFFRLEGNEAFVVACFHSSRDPRRIGKP